MEREGNVAQRWPAVLVVEATARLLGAGKAGADRGRAFAVGTGGETPSSANRQFNVL